MGGLLSKVVAGAAILGLGACAYATPYPAAFPDASGPRMAPADSGRGDGCQGAIENPGSSTSVLTCLRSRGQAWDNRGRAIRQQAGYVGQLSIPLGITGLGLSAAGDRSDFVPLSSGVSTAALAHTGAYARPSQAEVYELATDAYRCLLGAVAEWNSAGKEAVEAAFNLLQVDVVNAREALATTGRAAGLSDAEIRRRDAELQVQLGSARAALNRLDGDIGTSLLRRSDEIDAAVVRAIRDRLPDTQTIAASVAQTRTLPSGGTPTTDQANPSAPDTNAAAMFSQLSPADKARALSGDLGGSLQALLGGQAATLRLAALARINELIERANASAETFDLAAADYAQAAGPVTINCAFNPSQLPALLATPTETVLDGAGKGFFVVRNGVPPYGHLPLPAGVTLTPTPINGNAMRFEVNVNLASAGAGPWTLYVTDASAAGNMAEIKVSKAP